MNAITRSSSQRGATLGLWMCTALVVGNMVGSGVFLLPASLGAYGGISVVGWLITTAGAMMLALMFSRLSRMMPSAGGPYAYTRRGLGDFAGFLVAWGYWNSIWTSNAAIAVAFVSYLTAFWPGLVGNSAIAAMLAIGSIWLLSWVNAAGIKHAGIVQLVTSILKLVPLVVIATFGLLYFNGDHFTPFNVSGESTLSAISATVALTLWAFLGLESATVPADHVRDASRTIPRATILGTVIAAFVYVFGTVAVMGILSPATLAVSSAPFADAARRVWGDWAAYAVAAGAAISCFGALNGWIMLQGQIPLAAAKDDIFPAGFKRLSKRNTPAFGIVFSSVLVTLLICMNYTKTFVEQFNFIILLATLHTLIPYVLSAMSQLMIFVNERTSFKSERLFAPTLIASLAFLYSLWAVAGAGKEIVYYGFLFMLVGIPVYVWVVWRGKDARRGPKKTQPNS